MYLYVLGDAFELTVGETHCIKYQLFCLWRTTAQKIQCVWDD